MELKEYKIKLGNLSVNEQKLRDLYLRKLALGDIQGPPTSSPTINSRELTFYNEDTPTFIPLPNNVTKSLEENNNHNLDKNALEYGLNKIKYKTFINEKNRIVKSLIKNGITDKDYVAVCLPAIPEAMYMLYALGHINAAGIFMPPYLDDGTMLKDLLKGNSKLLIILDKFLDNEIVKTRIDKMLDNSHIEKIIVVPALYSALPINLGKKIIKKQDYGEKYIYWDEFLNEGKNEKIPSIAEYIPNHPIAVVYSSGSTGILKGIKLSHDSLVLPPQTYYTLGIDLTPGQRFYQSIPLWSSTGLIALGTSPLYYRSTIYQNPKLEPEVFIKNIGKKKINWAVGTRELFNNGIEQIKNDHLFHFLNKIGIYQYNQLSHILVGGTPISEKNKVSLTNDIQQLGGNINVEDSYGVCENAAIVTLAGIPLPGVKITILDQNHNELYYNQRGMVAINSPFKMLEYFSRDDLNNELFFDDMILTGDIGYLTEENKLVILGREKDFSVINNKKIYNFDLVNAILEDPNVRDCEVFSKQNKYGDSYLCVHLLLDENMHNNEEVLKRIQKNIFEKYNDLDFVPESFKIRSSFPISRSTKRDIELLKQEKDGYIYIDSAYLNTNNIKNLRKSNN